MTGLIQIQRIKYIGLAIFYTPQLIHKMKTYKEVH